MIDPHDHLRLAQKAARRYANLIGGEVEYDELLSAAMLGLLDACERFEPHRGLAFSTLAVKRITGAIQDFLRTIDPMTREERMMHRRADRAIADLVLRHNRTPTESEVADEMGVPVAEYWDHLHAVARHGTLWLDEPIGDSNGGELLSAVEIVADDAPATDAVAVAVSDAEHLWRLVDRLPTRQSYIVREMYAHGRTEEHIAREMGVSGSRICQLRRAAIKKLRHAYQVAA